MKAIGNANPTETTSTLPTNPNFQQPHNQHPPPTTQLMAIPRDWLTMQMLNPSFVENERITELSVFMPPSKDLKPTNRFLERAAFVFAGQYRNTPNLTYRIANRLAQQFNRDSMDFIVVNIEDTFGDLMVLFPNANIKDQAISVGVFFISVQELKSDLLVTHQT